MAKRALPIGINEYKIPGANLRGCVNDVKNLSAVLTQFYGFAAGDIKTLLDGQATKKNMRAGIKALITGASKGDVLVRHYSGHGANVPDDNGDEADHRDEILCPTDLDWQDPLRDDWLRATFDKPKKGVSLTVIMDCCHSGTNTRAILPPDAPMIPRYLPNPWDLMAEESGRKLKGRTRGEFRSSSPAARKRTDIANAEIAQLLITGCRSTRTSADARIGGSFNGALTWNLVAAIKEARGKLSYRELHAKTTRKLKAGAFDQVPQLQGMRAKFDRPFLAPEV